MEMRSIVTKLSSNLAHTEGSAVLAGVNVVMLSTHSVEIPWVVDTILLQVWI
jgi:hypothetical protein